MLGSSTRSTGPGTAAAWGSPAASAGCARGPSCSSRAPWPRVSPGGWQAMSSPIPRPSCAHRRRGLPGDLIRPAPPSRHRGGHRSGRRCLHCRPLRQPRGDRWMADRRRRHRRDESGAARRRRPGPRDAGGCTGNRGRPRANPGQAFTRWTDALIGGGVALVAASIAPQAPLRRPRVAASEVARKISELLRRAAASAEDRDVEAAAEVLASARETERAARADDGRRRGPLRPAQLAVRGGRPRHSQMADLIEPLDLAQHPRADSQGRGRCWSRREPAARISRGDHPAGRRH